MASILFGLMAALTWGGSDFAGGMASRRIGAFYAVCIAELLGLGLLLGALPFVSEPLPTPGNFLIGMGIGAAGSLALVLLYHSMTIGLMSIAMPVSALLAAALPILVGAFTEGLPAGTQLAGFACALAAVWLLTQESGSQRTHLQRIGDLRLPLIAGIGFGTYFILMHQISQDATLWPMIASRTGGSLFFVVLVLLRREKLRMQRAVWPLVIFNAIFDVSGNLFYILSGQSGRMDIAAVISALYPAATVFLAWLFLKERINRLQAVGILSALAGIALMTL